MGLDISYYKGVAKSDVELDRDGEPVLPNDDWSFYDDHARVYVNPDFPGREDDLKDGWYSVEDSDSFCAGSYGSYNRWRSELCLAALGVPPSAVWEGRVTEGPFYELVNFSDCEGVIGPKTSAKLAKDFADWEGKIAAGIDYEVRGYFMEKYAQWKAAFEMASQGGMVCFH